MSKSVLLREDEGLSLYTHKSFFFSYFLIEYVKINLNVTFKDFNNIIFNG